MTINYGRWGMYSGQKLFFTLRNPKTGDVWADELKYIVKYDKGKPVYEFGKWVTPDSVTWL